MNPQTPAQPETSEGNITPATKPRQVETWLAALPLTNPTHAAARLIAYLAVHRRSALDAELRQSLLELAMPPAQRIIKALTATPPSATAHPRQVDKAVDLLLEVANGYKLLVDEWAAGGTPQAGDSPLPGLLLRLLTLQRQVLEVGYASHAPCRAGIWLDIHRLYRFAVDGGLLTPVAPGSVFATSLERVYKSVLLEAIADPFHMSREEWGWTQEIVNRHAPLASILRADTAGQGGVYAIHVDRDGPPQPLAWQAGVRSERQFILNTTALVRTLALLATRLERDQGSEGAPRIAANRTSAYARHLDRLRQRWGASLQRHSPRRQPSREKFCEVSFDFADAYRSLCPAEFATHQAGTRAPASRHRCRIVDEAVGGIALNLEARPDFQLKIATLVFVFQDGPGCEVGLLRWFRAMPAGEVSFGVKFLLGQPTCLELRQGGRSHAGLLLRGNSADPGAGTLILSSLTVEPSTVVQAQLPDREIALRVLPHREEAADAYLFRSVSAE